MSGTAFPHPPSGLPPGLTDRRELRLAPEPASAAKARAFVVEHCPYDGSVRDAARLLVSELVTNVVLHARTPMTVGIASGDGAVLVTVTDDNEQLPPIPVDPERPADTSAEGGRGLTLLRLLAADYGVIRRAGGKTVWTLLRR